MSIIDDPPRHIQNLAVWRDTRADAKVEAAAKLASVKRQALWRAAQTSAAAARARGAPRYIGHICGRDPAHGGERFTSDGGCVACCREAATRRRRERGCAVRGPYLRGRHPLRSGKRQAARSRRAEESGADDRPYSEAAGRLPN
jgi:hypothetical protein